MQVETLNTDRIRPYAIRSSYQQDSIVILTGIDMYDEKCKDRVGDMRSDTVTLCVLLYGKCKGLVTL